jgi:leucyl-tRNA synthetase
MASVELHCERENCSWVDIYIMIRQDKTMEVVRWCEICGSVKVDEDYLSGVTGKWKKIHEGVMKTKIPQLFLEKKKAS